MVELVGILNITPDSFSDGGQFVLPELAIAHADKMLEEGASLIDVGAESTRPNATPLTSDEEWQRLKSVLKILIPRYPGIISLDSYHPETIERAFGIGPVIVNDVTGLNNPEMMKLVVKLKATVIISQLPDITLAEAHHSMPVSTIKEIRNDLLNKAEKLQSMGHDKSRIILDPGIGFGKTMDLNRQLLKFAQEVPDYNVMIGYSRKRFLGINRMDPDPNLKAARVAIASGAKYLRVHDVALHTRLLSR
jgi:dihydropteroate synthase